MSYRYILERYRSGGSNRYTCPNCHKRKCFTRYIDRETGHYLADDCGICDHESSCGYHYSPSEYFRDHPTDKDTYRPTSFVRKPVAPPPPPPLCTLPYSFVKAYHSQYSIFWQWMQSVVTDPASLQRVFEAYHIGSTLDRRVVFWQIDMQNRVRTGKIMRYTTDGHRTGNPNWIHSYLRSKGEIDSSWTLSQCFFGEHLLAGSDKPVALVESEKTAVILAAYMPQYTWIATGGCKQLNAEKCQVLRGRRTLIFPDKGELAKWSKIMAATQGIPYSISTALENGNYPPNTDIADLIPGFTPQSE